MGLCWECLARADGEPPWDCRRKLYPDERWVTRICDLCGQTHKVIMKKKLVKRTKIIFKKRKVRE